MKCFDGVSAPPLFKAKMHVLETRMGGDSVARQLLCIINTSFINSFSLFFHITALALPMAPFFSCLSLKIFQTDFYQGVEIVQKAKSNGECYLLLNADPVSLSSCIFPVIRGSCPSSRCAERS